MPRYKIKRKDIIRENEVKELIDKLGSPQDKAMVSMLYLFGARPCEIMTLKREDFKTDGKKIFVVFETRKKKGKVSRLIIPNRKLWCYSDDIFARYILEYVVTIPQGSRVFHYGSTEKSTNTLINRRLKRQNPNLCPYLFRHTRNTLIAENGGSESSLVVWNGWSDGRPAKFYVEHTQKMIDNVPSPKSEDKHESTNNK